MTKVLLIEDDASIRQMFKTSLTVQGFDVEEAVNGKEGIEKAKTVKPDIVVMDIVMPEMSGIDALKSLRADNETRNIPVMMMTNMEQDSLIREAMSWGAVSYIIKASITPQTLAKKINAFLSLPEDGEHPSSQTPEK